MLIRSDEDDHDMQQSTALSITSAFEDDTKIEVKPFLSRACSSVDVSATSKFYRVWRRRIGSDASFSALPGSPCRLSFQQDVRRAASDTYLVTRLAFKLLRYLGVGYRWISKFLALSCYAFLLIPGFLQVGYYYFFSNQVIRGIVYGDQPRNRLDLYIPKKSDGPKPVIAFVTGGAWIIGYKAWGSLLGQQLSERDIIVACIDYRNFPQGTISDMVKDASQGISFVCNNIAEYGGDPNRIYLMGQSAGAHIAACALVDQAIKEAGGGSISWSVTQLKSYFGLSGGYNLFNLVDHFHSRGLYRSIFLSIMEGEQSLKRFSPEVVVQDTKVRNAGPLLPPIILFHGNADYSIPSDSRCDSALYVTEYPLATRIFLELYCRSKSIKSDTLITRKCFCYSKTFAEALQRVGAKAKTVLYDGKTHTDLFLQDPMRGGKDDLFEDLVSSIHAGDTEALAKHAAAPLRRRLVPEFMLKLARSISPF